MLKIGDVIPCSNWYHGDLCQNEDCKRGWRERGEDRHVGCDWCDGAKLVRVTEINEDGSIMTVEPSPTEPQLNTPTLPDDVIRGLPKYPTEPTGELGCDYGGACDDDTDERRPTR